MAIDCAIIVKVTVKGEGQGDGKGQGWGSAARVTVRVMVGVERQLPMSVLPQLRVESSQGPWNRHPPIVSTQRAVQI